MAKEKKLRIPISPELSDEVLKLQDRTCCVCRQYGKDVQIHHIDENPANNAIDNLAVLCLQCHNDTMTTGGFGKKLTAGQVIKFRNDWLDIVKHKNENLEKGISPLESQQCWENITFNNQQGIESAILGIGLNQNHVQCCPKLNIFEEALSRLNIVNYVNIVGESGSGKSLTAFQISYEFFKKGYKVYKYNGKENPMLYSESAPAIYIFDNAHLYKEEALKIQQQANNNCKVICVYTDILDGKENSIRITSKQSVNMLYEFYKNNAENIIPIVRGINKEVGFEFGDVSYYSLINKASYEKSPYYFNYIIRGAAKYIKVKMDDYKNDGYLDVLAVIAIYQILSADNFISFNKFDELITSIKTININDFETKLIVQDRILIKENSGYKFSHIHTAINFLNSYILSSFDNQTIANKYFMLLIENNNYSNLGLLWYINNCAHDVSYNTHRHKYALFNKDEIDIIYNKVFENKDEPYFFSVIERMSRYHPIVHDDNTKSLLLSVINKSEGEDFICIGNFINMLINDAGRSDYSILDYYLKNIDLKRILSLFNGYSIKDLYKFVRFFDRFSYRSKKLKIYITQYLDEENFILKINNCNIDDIYTLSYLSSIFLYNDNKLNNIRIAIVNKICSFLQVNPLTLWNNLDNHSLYEIFGYDQYDNYLLKNERYRKPRIEFINNISISKLVDEIQNNFIYHWQSIAEFMTFIYLLDKNKCLDIIRGVDKHKLYKTIKHLWNTDNEFDILMAFAFDQKFLNELIILSQNDIDKVSLDLVYWCPKAALNLFKNKKLVDIKKLRNDYILTNAIINMLKVDKSFGLKILIDTKESVIDYIKREFYHGETDGKKSKHKFYKSLKKYEEDILNLNLSNEEKDVILNYDNYNLNSAK